MKKKRIVPPTPEQVQAEIELLSEMKNMIRQYNGFNEDNHAVIDAAIAALEGIASEEDYEGENDDEYIMLARERDGFIEAMDWLHGHIKDRPSDGWKDLVKK